MKRFSEKMLARQERNEHLITVSQGTFFWAQLTTNCLVYDMQLYI